MNTDFKELDYVKKFTGELLPMFSYIVLHGKLDFYIKGQEPELKEKKHEEINTFVSNYEGVIYAGSPINDRLTQEVRQNLLVFQNEFQAKQYLTFLDEEIASLIRVIKYRCKLEEWESEVKNDRINVDGRAVAILTISPFRMIFNLAFDFVQELTSASQFIVNKLMELSPDSISLLERPAHKVLLLHELGILDFLTTKYFSSHQTIRTDTDKAKLVALIIGVKNHETVRKGISGIHSKGKDNITTAPAIRAVKGSLIEFGIDLDLKDLDL